MAHHSETHFIEQVIHKSELLRHIHALELTLTELKPEHTKAKPFIEGTTKAIQTMKELYLFLEIIIEEFEQSKQHGRSVAYVNSCLQIEIMELKQKLESERKKYTEMINSIL